MPKIFALISINWPNFCGSPHAIKSQLFYGYKERAKRNQNTRSKQRHNVAWLILTIVRIVEIDNALPAIVLYGINNCLMIIRSHADREIQQARRRGKHLKVCKTKRRISGLISGGRDSSDLLLPRSLPLSFSLSFSHSLECITM